MTARRCQSRWPRLSDQMTAKARVVEQQPTSRRRIILGLAVVAMLLGVLAAAADWDEFRRLVGEADWQPVPVALLLTAISYACISYSFARVSQVLGIRMGWRGLTEIGFVTTVLNHLLTGGGIVGYSMRYMLMQGHGVAMKDVLAASILHFYLTSLAMLATLPFGIAYLLANAPITEGLAIAIGLVTLLLALVSIVATALIFVGSLRGTILRMLYRAVRVLTHRNIEPTLSLFDATMTRGVAIMRERPLTLFLIVVLDGLDWLSSAAVLWFCFDALGPPVQPAVLLSGFVIGMMAGALSIVPGGLGIQEGSMAGVFALLGTPFEQAVLTAVLFRGIYYLLPCVVSWGFYVRLVRRTGPKGRRWLPRTKSKIAVE